jgi:hypothetical protein
VSPESLRPPSEIDQAYPLSQNESDEGNDEDTPKSLFKTEKPIYGGSE